ncbi:MAG: hypothetical protein B7Z37_21105 [Verrucomicrobia bacterium 12-59-8]|nr:MAG: hypothetical protein B7Z37_21105 [Verrucomicrobia bacterium 12-59-8]
MKSLILKGIVSLFAITCLTAAAGPQGAAREPGRVSQAHSASQVSGAAGAAAPAPGTFALVWVKLWGGHPQTAPGTAGAKKPASVGAVWIVALIYAIYLSVPLGIVALLLPRGSSGSDDEPEDMPPPKKMKKPHDHGGGHPLNAWLWPQPHHA